MAIQEPMDGRRRSRRFDLSLPVKVRFPYPIDRPPLDGNTRDISRRGVYFIVSGTGIEVAADLSLEITLSGVVTGGTDVAVRAIGRAVRVEEVTENNERRIGVAMIIETYEIIRHEANAAAG